MRIVGISDIHGNLVNIPKCDVLCICGDIVGLNDQRSMDASHHWFNTRFIKWINSLSCKKVFAVPGNHDFYIENCYNDLNSYSKNTLQVIEGLTNNKLKFLIDESFNYKGLKFYGTPWIRCIGMQKRWAFEMEFMMEGPYQFENIPNDIDIILSHDEPYKNKDLLNYTKDIKYHFYGHWHEGLSNPKENRYNCSLLNNDYYLKHKPVMIDIMTDKEKNDLIKEIVNKIKEKTDFDSLEYELLQSNLLNESYPLEQRCYAIAEILEILNTFIQTPTIDKEDETDWIGVITGEKIDDEFDKDKED